MAAVTRGNMEETQKPADHPPKLFGILLIEIQHTQTQDFLSRLCPQFKGLLFGKV